MRSITLLSSAGAVRLPAGFAPATLLSTKARSASS